MYRRSIVNLTVRRGCERALLLATVGILALTGCSRSSGTSVVPAPTSVASHAPAPASSQYTLMQWNVCLSGLADCYGKVAYPAVLAEAVAQIRDARPDAVTVSEACRNDVALIARRTGYHLRFSRVIYLGRPSAASGPAAEGSSVTRC